MAKRAFIENFGVDGGFAIYKTLIGRHDHEEIQRKRRGSLREIAESGLGAFHLCEPSQPFVVPPPVVVGAGGAVGPLAARARSMYVACLIDARIRAGSDVIEVDDLALFDQEAEEQLDYQDGLDADPGVFRATEERVWMIAPQGATASIEIPEAFTLLGRNAGHFGHLLGEYIPKYIAAILSKGMPRVPVIIEAGLGETFGQVIDQLLSDAVEIIELPRFATARVRRLWCAPALLSFPVQSAPYHTPATPPARYAPVVKEMARRMDRVASEPTGAERVFLAREPPGPKALLNQAEILATAEARGFVAVYPNRLSFIDQVRFVRHAHFVVGPAGGSMLLLFFARPGTKICSFRCNEDVFTAQADMTGLYEETGLDVTIFTGSSPHPHPSQPWNSDYEIDEAMFERFLDQWLKS